MVTFPVLPRLPAATHNRANQMLLLTTPEQSKEVPLIVVMVAYGNSDHPLAILLNGMLGIVVLLIIFVIMSLYLYHIYHHRVAMVTAPTARIRANVRVIVPAAVALIPAPGMLCVC